MLQDKIFMSLLWIIVMMPLGICFLIPGNIVHDSFPSNVSITLGSLLIIFGIFMPTYILYKKDRIMQYSPLLVV